MFRKLISNVTFSPALVGQLGFYARRLRKEEATRRVGLLFTVLALIVQSFAVFSPPEPANAASSSDFVRGGVSSMNQYLGLYDQNTNNLKDMLTYIGITREEMAAARKTTINSRDGWLSWGRTSPFSAAQGDTTHTYTKDDGSTGTMHAKPLKLWDSTSYTRANGSTYVAWIGTSAKIGTFAIMANCGNAATKKLPTPPKYTPVIPKPLAVCRNLEVIRVTDNERRFAVTTLARLAQINNYHFVITDRNGKTIQSFDYKSSNSSITTGNVAINTPGQYTVKAVVATSIGDKTSTNCTSTFTIDQPGIAIEKTVNDQERISVALDQTFTYKIVVRNTGNTTLENAVVSDSAPAGIQFLSASQGEIKDNKWSVTIPSFVASQSQTFTIQAKATSAADPEARVVKNVACVDTTSINGNPDACDSADVELPETDVTVCDLATNTTKTIKKSEYDSSKYSTNLNDCVRFQVCDLQSKTVITIREPSFDDTKYTKDLTQCDDIEVCDKTSGEIVVIKRSELDTNRYSEDANDCIPAVAQEKSASNLSQNGKNAAEVTAQANDRIQYTITVQNVGDVDTTAKFEEHLQDVVEYATVIDNGGGSYDSDTKTLTWSPVTLKPGERASRLFTVKLASTIPAGAQGVSDRSSYDCKMTNTFGNVVDVKVNCPAQKQIEQTVTQLPTTGPTENMLFAGLLIAIVTFFYARSRQMAKEVRLVRREINTGAL